MLFFLFHQVGLNCKFNSLLSTAAVDSFPFLYSNQFLNFLFRLLYMNNPLSLFFCWWNSTHFLTLSDYLHYFFNFWLSSGCGMHSYGFGLIKKSELGIIFHTQSSSSFTTICNLHHKITNRTTDWIFVIISSSSTLFINHCYGCCNYFVI